MELFGLTIHRRTYPRQAFHLRVSLAFASDSATIPRYGIYTLVLGIHDLFPA